MRRAIGTEPTCFAEGAGVPLVGLNLLIARGVHGREVRVGDDDCMPEFFEVTGDPLAFGRGFDKDAYLRAISKHFIKA